MQQRCLYLCINVLCNTFAACINVIEFSFLSGNWAWSIFQRAAGDWHFVVFSQVSVIVVFIAVGTAAAELHNKHNDNTIIIIIITTLTHVIISTQSQQ